VLSERIEQVLDGVEHLDGHVPSVKELLDQPADASPRRGVEGDPTRRRLACRHRGTVPTNVL
jgi:hypothetical protein